MIKRTRAEISKCIIHKVANKYNSGHNALSENLVRFDEDSYELLLPFLLKPFQSATQSYRFDHRADISLNRLNKLSQGIFGDEDNFIENSKKIVEHLYEQSNSASIKTGDVLVIQFENIEYRDSLVSAVGVFKIEVKSDFFQTFKNDEEDFDVVVQKGISPKKLDKGCQILNISDVEGPIVLSIDNNNYDAQYWIKNFLEIKFANDKNLHTEQYLEFCKDFADSVVKVGNGAQDQNIFLAETVDYFKENEYIDFEDFKETVFSDEKLLEKFEEHKKLYEKINDISLKNGFLVSDEVLKKKKGKFKSDIKLDTNIRILIDVDAPYASSEYLERGYDEEKKMKFYKVYYNSEK